MIDSVQKIAAPPARGVAREELTLVIDGAKQPVEIERRALPRGGSQAFWLCPKCGALRYDLYIVDGVLLCRCCHKLDYRSRHVLHPALIRAAKLRRKLGAAPGLLSRLPPRPRRWRRDYWSKLVVELARTEDVIVQMLSATIRAAKRQRVKLDGR